MTAGAVFGGSAGMPATGRTWRVSLTKAAINAKVGLQRGLRRVSRRKLVLGLIRRVLPTKAVINAGFDLTAWFAAGVAAKRWLLADLAGFAD